MQDFLTECDELLEQLDQDFVAIESRPEDNELLNRIFRAFHTIKGTSGFMGFQRYSDDDPPGRGRPESDAQGRAQSHPARDGRISERSRPAPPHARDIRQGAPRNTNSENCWAGFTNSWSRTSRIVPCSAKSSWPTEPFSHAERREALQQAVESKQRLGEVLIEKQFATPIQIRDVAAETSRGSRMMKEAARTIRVDVNKLDETCQSRRRTRAWNAIAVAQLTRDFRPGVFSSEEFERRSANLPPALASSLKNLQAASLKTRMVPIDVVFRRFPRMVRDLSNSLGKKCSLVIRGEDTELDKTIVEEIADPLVHLIRNSLDHGIEPPSAREKAGKPRKGTMRLEARPEGDFIIGQIEDDGAGIDPERIATKAVEKGIVTFESAEDDDPPRNP